MIFLGCLFDRNSEEKIISDSKVGISNAINTYQWNLIDGFVSLKQKLKIVNVIPVGTYKKYYNKLLLKDKNWSYKDYECFEVGSINLPFLKQFQRYKKIRNYLEKADDKNIIIYSAYEPFLHAVYKLDKKYSITLIVPDLPDYYDLSNTNFIKKILRKINNKMISKYLERIDQFILLTEQMKYPLCIGKRPYVVIEGICNDKNIADVIKINVNKKIILYTGTLNYAFGITNLIEAFTMIKNKNYELWICGAGEAKNSVIKYAEIDKRIKFLGFQSKDAVVKLQNKADILINPRQNVGEYTKYSFPSKTIEYMLTGKPIIMYKLDGIPDEYDKYLHYVDGNEIIDLKNKIEEVCSIPNQELIKMGYDCRQWLLDNKNGINQAEKIIELVKQNEK